MSVELRVRSGIVARAVAVTGPPPVHPSTVVGSSSNGPQPHQALAVSVRRALSQLFAGWLRRTVISAVRDSPTPSGPNSQPHF